MVVRSLRLRSPLEIFMVIPASHFSLSYLCLSPDSCALELVVTCRNVLDSNCKHHWHLSGRTTYVTMNLRGHGLLSSPSKM